MTTSDTRIAASLRVVDEPVLGSEEAQDPSEGPTPIDYDRLATLARNGDSGAWERIYVSLFDAIHRHVWYMTCGAEATEDLVQEAFVQGLSSLHKFSGRSSLSTWMHAVASNVVRKHWRSNTRRHRAYARYEVAGSPGQTRIAADPENRHLQQCRADVLVAVLEELPDHLREVFLLIDVRRVDPKVAAAQLGITKNNLHVRAARARKKVRAMLRRRGWMTEGAP